MGMNLGLLLGAVSGAGQDAQASLASQQTAQQALDLEQAKSDADLQRSKALADYGVQLTSQQRNAATSAIGQNYQGLLNSKVTDLANSGDVVENDDGSTRPFTASDIQDARNGQYTNADGSTYVPPSLSDSDNIKAHMEAQAQYDNNYSELGKLNNSSEIAQLKMEQWANNAQAKLEGVKYQADTKQAISDALLKFNEDKGIGKQMGAQFMLQSLNSQITNLTNENRSLYALKKDSSGSVSDADRADAQASIDDNNTKIKNFSAGIAQIGIQAGIKVPDFVNSSAVPNPPAHVANNLNTLFPQKP